MDTLLIGLAISQVALIATVTFQWKRLNRLSEDVRHHTQIGIRCFERVERAEAVALQALREAKSLSSKKKKKKDKK